MRDKKVTQAFYVRNLGFELIGDYPDYLLLKKDEIEIHFFLFRDLNPLENYGQVYIRTNNIEMLYSLMKKKNVPMPILGGLEIKPWRQKEFSILDPDHNLVTFGESTEN